MRTLLRKITRFASGRLSAAIAGVCVIGLLTAGNFTETFDTNLYKDDANTTALWDTVPGTLSLFPISMSLVTTFAAGSDIIHVAIWGDFAYLTYNGPAGEDVRVVDISNPASPSIVGTLNTQNPRSVTIVGDLAHVADGTTGLRIFNITNPLAATQVGLYDTPGSAEEVFVAGNHAYVADGDSGLVIVDITAVASPTLAGRYVAAAPASGVEVHGDYAFVATGLSGLEVVDISDPSLPALAGSYDTPGLACEVAVEGDVAYVADNSGGLQVIDITDPTSPTLMGSYATSGNALDVFVDGDFAYVTDDVAGLLAFDVSLPASPVLFESFATSGSASQVIIEGHLAFVADGTGGLQVVQAAQEVATVAPAVPLLPVAGAFVNRLEIYGNYAYIAGHSAGLIVIDISNPGSPFIAANYAPVGITYNARVSGDYLYIATSVGIEIVDISDPTNPVLITAFAVGGFNEGAFLDGDRIYLASRSLGMQIVDVSNPAAPALLGTYTPGNFYDVVVLGNHAFLADLGTGLTIIDVSNSASPTLVSSMATVNSPFEVTVEGDYAYIAERSSGFEIVDISNVASPTVVATISTAHWAYDSFISGNRLYVVKGQAGFEIHDITDPTAPTLVNGFDFGVGNEQVNAIWVTGGVAFLGRGGNSSNAGLAVIPVSERGFDRGLNQARSSVVDGEDGIIIAARLTTTPPVVATTWELSADSGSTWDEFPPSSTWKAFAVPGTELMWRTTFDAIGSPASVTRLDIEWLNDFSTITSVLDIPGDQGKQARVSWVRSGYDLQFSPSPIFNYAIYRRIDSTPAPVAEFDPGVARETGPYDIGELMRALPPGSWEYLTLVPAAGSDLYSTVVPTVADSTITNGLHNSVFFVRALTNTPGIHYDSKPDSGYSVDNLAPVAPTGFLVMQNPPSGNQLDWDSPVNEDFDYFRIYRSTESDFDPMPGDLVHATSDIAWLDPINPGWQYHYKITAVDHSGNESDYTGPETVTGILPTAPRFALYQNHPNPFNPTTRIDFSADRTIHVNLTIYDAGGRRIATLIDRTVFAGLHHADWDGRDSSGGAVATGVYFYRLTSGDRILTRKAVLLK